MKTIEYFTEKNKNIFVNFDEILGDPKLKQFNMFELYIGKKRIYAMMAKTICEDNNKILNLDKRIANKVIFSYLTLKKGINSKLFVKKEKENVNENDLKRDFGKYESFINFLIMNLFTNEFVNLVRKYVDDNYIPVNMNEEIDDYKESDIKNTGFVKIIAKTESEKINMKPAYSKGTTFTNEQFKMLYVVSILIKFAIPLCTHYIYVNSDKNINVFNFMQVILTNIFKIVVIDTECSDLMNKLYQYVSVIVKRTEHYNKLIWNQFPIYNDTRESIIDELVMKIITTIVPKFRLDKSIISLITVVSRESIISHKIKANHQYDCYRINDTSSSLESEEDLSENDIFDFYWRPQDENLIILNKYANDDAVDSIARRNNIYFDPKEIKFYLNNYKIHNFTVILITQIFARFFSGSTNVRSCNFEQFVKLMIILIRKMDILDINYLKHFVTAKRESYSFIRTPSASIMRSLKNNYDYNDLISRKYRYVESVFNIKTNSNDDKNPIKDMIIGLVHNNYSYNEYGNKMNGQLIKVDEQMIINDVLAIYKRMII